jgi:predicted transcriptional regulator
MLIDKQKITLKHSTIPKNNDINEELQWLASSLGLFNTRDKDKSCYRIFLEIIKSSKRKQQLSSDEISERLKLSRGTVVHHLNKLIESGIIISNKNKYYLRDENLSTLIDEIERDSKRIFEDIKEIASRIDSRLGIKYRNN